ncbi:MAG: FHA domain-containing protein [Planctomycetota bacterium]
MAIKLFVQKGGEEPRELDFEGPVVLIGRGETNDLVVDDVRSSRKHCSVSETPQGAVLEDLGSSNGISYNGEPVKRTLLESGDKFAIGSTSFYYDKCSVSSSPEPVVEQPGSQAGAGEDSSDADDLLLEVETTDAGGGLEAIEAVEGEEADIPDSAAEEPGGREGGAVLSLRQVVGELEDENVKVQSLPFSIGRSSSCDLTLSDQRASGHHAELVEKDGVLAVKDLGSKNGVLVDERKVKNAGVIGDGSRFTVGSHIFDVRIEDDRLRAASSRKAERQTAKRDEVVAKGEPSEARKLNVDVDSLGQGGALQQIGSVVALVIIVVVSAYFCVDVAQRLLAVEIVDPVADANKITNWSFEDLVPEGSREDLVVGWEAGADSLLRRVKDRGIRGGNYAMELVGGADADDSKVYSAAQGELVRVVPGDQFLLEGFVTNRGAFLAGLMVEWLRAGDGEKLVGRSFSAPVRGTGGGEVELDASQVIKAPAGAGSARISCFLVGSGKACFDQVYFAKAELAGDEAVAGGAASLERKAGGQAEALVVGMDSPGIFSLRRGKRIIFSSFWAGLDTSRDPNAIGPKLTDPELRSGEDGTQIAPTEVPDLQERKWIAVENIISSDSSSVSLRWQLETQGGKADAKRALVLYFSSHDPGLELVAHGPRTGADFILSEASGGPFDELVAGDGVFRTSMEFTHTVKVSSMKHPVIADRWLLVVIPADGASDLGVTFSHGSRREAQAAKMVLAEAERLFGDGIASEALDLLDGLETRYPLQTIEIERAKKRIAQWNGDAAKVVSDLDVGRDAYRINPSEVIYRSLYSRGRLLARRYANTRAGDSVGGFLAELDSIRSSASIGKIKTQQEELIARAKEAMENQQLGIAGACLKLLLGIAEKESQLYKDAVNLKGRLDTRREAVNKIKLGQ